jgi:uncharacterized protein involved in exopolysaccharide biosynthesis
MKKILATSQEERDVYSEDEVSFFDVLALLVNRWRLIISTTLAFAVVTAGFTLLLPDWYTGRTLIVPPQQQQSTTATALAQIGALAGLTGATSSIKSPADQYVAFMQSTTVSDRLIRQFNLQTVYEAKYLEQARKALAGRVRISIGKKDGLISIEVDDSDPKRAADISNAYVDQLRLMTNTLAVSEAQQRRTFFEQQLTLTKERLAKAQVALEESGINQGALRVEPKAAAEGYARLRAQMTAAEVRLQTLNRVLAENAPEVLQQKATLDAIRQQLAREEQQDSRKSGSAAYVDRFREFKYQEALFDIFVKQYELARVDESREGALVQVVDAAVPSELKAGPKRARMTVFGALGGFVLASFFVIGQSILARHREQAGMGA